MQLPISSGQSVGLFYYGVPGFCSLFCPFHKDTDKFTNGLSNQAREEIFTLGAPAKRATKLKVSAQKRSWITDH